MTTAYFPSVEWYRRYLHEGRDIDHEECYQKQTARNHCVIATANGVQKLTVPVSLPTKRNCPIRDVRVSDHGNWRHQHWEALCSAYGMSPFFEYYADDIRPFFEKKWEFLIDFNDAIHAKMCDLIGIDGIPMDMKKDSGPFVAESPVYYQTFQMRHGFIPNLSSLDLLFNEGPEAITFLI